MSEFKVGDRVYCPFLSRMILTVSLWKKSCLFVESKEGHTCFFDDDGLCTAIHAKDAPQAVLIATPENHALLSQLYPNVEFEKPKAVGSDLTRQMLAEGKTNILCWLSDESDDAAIANRSPYGIFEFDGEFFIGMADPLRWHYAVPVPRNYYAMDDE